MILTKWQGVPFRGATILRDEIDQLFGHALNRLASYNGTEGEALMSGWSPALDLYDSHDNFVVKAELPGMKKEDINISLQDGVLTVAGERKDEKEFSTAETYRSERMLGRFQRTIRLPSQVNAEHIKATYKDGVLTVVLPKSEEAKPKQIPVHPN